MCESVHVGESMCCRAQAACVRVSGCASPRTTRPWVLVASPCLVFAPLPPGETHPFRPRVPEIRSPRPGRSASRAPTPQQGPANAGMGLASREALSSPQPVARCPPLQSLPGPGEWAWRWGTCPPRLESCPPPPRTPSPACSSPSLATPFPAFPSPLLI